MDRSSMVFVDGIRGPMVGELTPDVESPAGDLRFYVARDVEVDLVEDPAGRKYVTHYLHGNGRWYSCCFYDDWESHGYCSREEAERRLAALETR